MRSKSATPVVIFSLLFSVAACRSEGAESRNVLARPPLVASERVIQSVEWKKTVLAGGAANDSALVSPYRLSASADGLTMIDFYPKQVRRYDFNGTPVWTYGRSGSGPGEFQQPLDMKVDDKGRAWILDPINARVTIVASDGRSAHFVSLQRLEGNPHEIAPITGDRAVLVLSNPDRPLAVVDTGGRVVSRHPFPAPEFGQLHYLATQLITASRPSSGRWIAAYRMGDGFFLFSAADPTSRRGWFVEEVPFPEVVVTKKGGTTNTRHLERPVSAARSVTLSHESVYVLFGGTSADRSRLVDRYSLATGGYVESYRLPQKVQEIAWHEGRLYALLDDPYPELARFEPADGAPLP